MSEALARVSRELVSELRSLDESELRKVVLAVCSAAVRVSEVTDARARQALDSLRRGVTGDVVERIDVRTLVGELDVIAWDVQDRVDAGEATDGQYRVAFRQARAAAALDRAFGVDVLGAAYEALYEASFAIDNLDVLRAAVQLRTGQSGQ